MKTIHKPVLLKESIDLLNVTKGVYVDCTLGGGGHTLEIAKKLQKHGGKLVCFDADENAIESFKKRLQETGWIEKEGRYIHENVEIILIHKNFAHLTEELERNDIHEVNGLIADLGLSSDQLEDTQRGFSYQEDGPLDMRMDPNLGVTAADLVNGLYEKELVGLFRDSDEPHAKKIAQAVVKERSRRPITQTMHLIQIIQKALPYKARRVPNRKTARQPFRQERAYWLKPAMRVFQSLRIAVNSELSSLQKMLPQAVEALVAGSRMAIISFHSGEDRIVKNYFKDSAREGTVQLVTKKPIEANDEEKRDNMRARSAKLRVIEKLVSSV